MSQGFESAVSEMPMAGGNAYAAALAAVGLYDPIEVTLHVPFAVAGAFVCGCAGKPATVLERADYLDAVRREIDAIADCLAGRGRLSGVTFGAGAPLLLSPDEIGAVLAEVERALCLTDDADIRLEADFRDLTEPAIEQFSQLGVTQMTLCEADQAEVGFAWRAPTQLSKAISALRRVGIAEISIAAPPIGGAIMRKSFGRTGRSIGIGAGAYSRIGTFSGRNPLDAEAYVETVRQGPRRIRLG